MFGDKVAHFGATPSTDNPRTRALLGVQGKTNKKPFEKRKVAYKLICHYKCITNAITKKFTHVVKELEMRKMEMTKFIRCQMIWNEEK